MTETKKRTFIEIFKENLVLVLVLAIVLDTVFALVLVFAFALALVISIIEYYSKSNRRTKR